MTQSKKIERFLRNKFAGNFRFENDACVKCEKNHPERVINVKRLDVSGRTIEVDYMFFGTNFQNQNKSISWVQNGISRLINYGHGLFKIKLNEITKQGQIKRSVYENFFGENRFKNHDFVITKLNMTYRPKRQADSTWWRKNETFDEFYNNPENWERFTFNIVFKMRFFKGDRQFIFDHIKEMIIDHINKGWPGNHFIEVNVRMEKP